MTFPPIRPIALVLFLASLLLSPYPADAQIRVRDRLSAPVPATQLLELLRSDKPPSYMIVDEVASQYRRSVDELFRLVSEPPRTNIAIDHRYLAAELLADLNLTRQDLEAATRRITSVHLDGSKWPVVLPIEARMYPFYLSLEYPLVELLILCRWNGAEAVLARLSGSIEDRGVIDLSDKEYELFGWVLLNALNSVAGREEPALAIVDTYIRIAEERKLAPDDQPAFLIQLQRVRTHMERMAPALSGKRVQPPTPPAKEP